MIINMENMFGWSENFNKRLTTWGNKLPRNANLNNMFDPYKSYIVKKIAPWYYTRNQKNDIMIFGLIIKFHLQDE